MPLSKSANTASRLSVILAFAAIYLLWGSSYLGIRFGLESFPPFLMMGARFSIAGAILIAWARLHGVPTPTRIDWREAVIAGGALFFIGNGLLVWAQQQITSGLTALMMALIPAWIVLLDWLRPGGKRPNNMVIFGVVLGFGGIALLISPGNVANGQNLNILGVGAVIGAGIFWAIGTLYSRQAALPESPIMSTGMQLFCGGILLFLTGIITGQVAQFHPDHVSLRSVVSLAHLIFSGSIIGFSAYVWLLRVCTPSQVATYAYVNPVVAMFLGWVLGGETLTRRTLLAAAIIIAAVIIIISYQGQKHSKIGTLLKRKIIAEHAVH